MITVVQRHDSGKIPAAHQQIGRFVHIAAELLAAPERQFIEKGSGEPVRDVVGRKSVVERQIKRVLHLTHISRRARSILSQSLAPGVGSFESKTLAHAFFGRKEQGVIVRRAAAVEAKHPVPFGPWNASLHVSRPGLGCVVVFRVLEVRALRAQILRLDDSGLGHFLGDAQAPLLRVARFPIVLRSGE